MAEPVVKQEQGSMSETFAQLLAQRGFGDDFLAPSYEETLTPWLLPDLPSAVRRIAAALAQGEKILIYGDYDADGVTASAVLHDALSLAGAKKLEIMLPNRFMDGYGMGQRVVERAKSAGVNLVITVDCGSRNHTVVRQLEQAGVDVIITDHHECEQTIPAAVAVVNAKRLDALAVAQKQLESLLDCHQATLKKSTQNKQTGVKADKLKKSVRAKTEECNSLPISCENEFFSGVNLVKIKKSIQDLDRGIQELRELAGVGVAFKLAQALVEVGLIPEGQEKWLLDLVLIGTICDSMILTGENRRLCFYGIKVMEKTRRPGLKELVQSAGVKDITGEAIGFQIGPRINAAGRMQTAERALELVLAKNRAKAASLAVELEALNEARRKQQVEAVAEIRQRGENPAPVLVEVGDWHEGILGIIAGRLTEEYRRPAFALSEVDGILKGSGRSFGDFNLASALQACAEQIIGGGGHAAACGVKLEKAKLEDFRHRLNQYYRELNLVDQERFLDTREDLTIRNFKDLSLELIAELKQLEPYGEGNAEPVFLLPAARIIEATKLGRDKEHLRLLVWDRQGNSFKLMAFGASPQLLDLCGGETADIWITLEENVFRGTRSPEGRVVKIANVERDF